MVNYTTPESVIKELSDDSYDGKLQDGVLSGGLGRLVDGEIGADNYHIEAGNGKGNEDFEASPSDRIVIGHSLMSLQKARVNYCRSGESRLGRSF